MVSILLTMLYVGGFLGVVKSAPEEHNPTHVLISGVLWPVVIFSVFVEKFMSTHVAWTWSKKSATKK